ncbi:MULTISPECIES: hypothetical protein [Bacillus cereus group]|uniref:hypothetical protein n=1 Tax=Bacillus cereus group TaxID=86661 RepID=UPI000BFAA0CA|nr:MULTISPECIES: hypothetical protein [Bacillus cereus group]MBE5096907.1 hypothetical protein [Bacillus thuringiensis]PFO59743.1 hypothetical protein COJ83_29150 [Bacillus cereus]PGW87880.1 hypothetical protein COE32_29565 [Bacillus cereus]PGX89339.1 hypothetical protein COE41_30670 [Bacillus thuringiensis]PGY34504.1 hypothetical protein COE06_29220 [Bacillus cereus]
MKERNAEFLLAFIGSILGTVSSFFVFLLSGFIPATRTSMSYMFSTPFIVFLLQIVVIVLSCSITYINKRLYGVIMISIALISLSMNFFFMLIPATFYIISGGLAFRPIDNNSIQREE